MNNLSMYSGCVEVVDNEAILESTLQDTGKNVRDVERQRLPQDGGTHTCSASEYFLRMLMMLKIPVEETKKDVRVLTVLMATIWTPSMHPCRAKKESPSTTNTRALEQTGSEQQPKTYWNSAVHVTAVLTINTINTSKHHAASAPGQSIPTFFPSSYGKRRTAFL